MWISAKSTESWSIEESTSLCLHVYACWLLRCCVGMNVNCTTSNEGGTTGGGRGGRSRDNNGHTTNSDGQQITNHFRADQQQSQKRPRSGPQPSGNSALASVTSTMQSTAAIIPPDNDLGSLKAKGHYSNSSSMELYFAWFSAITFIGELFIGEHHIGHRGVIWDDIPEDQRNTNLIVSPLFRRELKIYSNDC